MSHKKRTGLIILVSMLAGSVITVQANSFVKKISAELRGDYSIVVDGEKINLGEQYPITYNNTTYLPLRMVGNAINKEVSWDAKTKTVTLGEPAPKGNTLYDVKKIQDIVYGELSKNTDHVEGGTYAYYIPYVYTDNKYAYATFDISGGYQTVEGKFKNFSKCSTNMIIRDQDDVILKKIEVPAYGIIDFNVSVQKATVLKIGAEHTVTGYQGGASFIDLKLN